MYFKFLFWCKPFENNIQWNIRNPVKHLSKVEHFEKIVDGFNGLCYRCEEITAFLLTPYTYFLILECDSVIEQKLLSIVEFYLGSFGVRGSQ